MNSYLEYLVPHRYFNHDHDHFHANGRDGHPSHYVTGEHQVHFGFV